MTKQTNLSLAKVKQVSKQLDQTRVHIIEEGNFIGEQITFQPIFDDVKIEELIIGYAQLLKEAEEKGITVSANNQVYFLYMQVIKYFTHFSSSIPSSLLGEGNKAGFLDTLKYFRKTGLFEECINRMFLPEQLSRVFNKATDMAATGLLSQDLDKKMTEKLEKLKVQNKAVFEQLEQINIENNAQ